MVLATTLFILQTKVTKEINGRSMKKFEYKIGTRSFNIDNNLSSNMIKMFDEEGAKGWELVQWQVGEEQFNVSSLFHNTKSITKIITTWKREINK